MYFLIDSPAKNAIDIFRRIMLLLSTCALELINYTFDIFIKLGKAEFLTSSQIQSIYSRVTLILGIFMLFKMIFSFIQYLINPETMSDKSKGAGKLIMKAVLVVAMLGFTPYIFTGAFKLQNAVVDSNILAKVIFGKSSDVEVNNFGYELSSSIFFDFYSSNIENIEEYCDDLGPDMENLRDEIKYHGTFSYASSCINTSLEKTSVAPWTWFHGLNEGYVIDFKWHGIVLVGVSIFVLYILLSYCLSVGIRVIQLGFLQLIAPIPILSYLGEDKDGAFSKWIKRCVSTFIDLFIRLAIIYFVVYAIDLILGANSDSYWYFMSTTDNPTGFTKILLSLILILGMLLFAKKAPELLKELLPQGIGSNIGFGFGNVKEAWGLAKKPLGVGKRAIGFVGGAATGAAISGISRYKTQKLRNFDKDNKKWEAGGKRKAILGAFGGVGVGLVTGARTGSQKGGLVKNMKGVVDTRTQSDNLYTDLVNAGGSSVGKFVSKASDVFGSSRGTEDKRKIDNATYFSKKIDEIESIAESTNMYKRLKHQYEHPPEKLAGQSDQDYQRMLAGLYDNMENYKEAFINASLSGKSLGDNFTFTQKDCSIVPHMETKIEKRGTGKYVNDYEERTVQVESGLFDSSGRPIMKDVTEKVKVGSHEIMEDVEVKYQDGWDYQEKTYDSTFTIKESESTKAAQINSKKVELQTNVNATNTVFVDEKGAETLVGDVANNWSGMSKQSKSAKRTVANIQSQEGYAAGQANLNASGGSKKS